MKLHGKAVVTQQQQFKSRLDDVIASKSSRM